MKQKLRGKYFTLEYDESIYDIAIEYPFPDQADITLRKKKTK